MSAHTRFDEREARRQAHRTRALLVKRYPKTFGGRGKAKRPLKLGISYELAEACPDISLEDIRLALWDYCTGMSYLRSMVAGASRIGLDGLPHGEVTAQAERVASEQVTRQEARRAAARERDRLRREHVVEGAVA